MSSQTASRTVPKLLELVRPAKLVRNESKDQVKLMEHLCQEHKLLSMPTNSHKNVAHVGGEKSYMLLGSLAKLERALMKWSMNELIAKHNFKPVVVPNIIYDNIVDRCGFPTKSQRSQVFKIAANNEESILDENGLRSNSDNRTHSCIAGTSEFALASIHIGDIIPSDELPKKYCAFSRCYRAETSNVASEWGIYRVKYFNKVEMVALTMPDRSEEMHNEFLEIQKDLFNQLELHYKVLEMPEDDLGLSAKKKYDIEAWLEGRKMYGEISSTSNCTDYQSSRLNVKYSKMFEQDGQLKVDSNFIHTVNGTACSSVRTMIALIEQHQTDEGSITVPLVLRPYMDGIERLPTKQDEILLKELEFYPGNVATQT